MKSICILYISYFLLTGSDSAQGWTAGRDRARVLLLRRAQRLRTGVHSSQGRLRRGPAVSSAVRSAEFSQGYELVCEQFKVLREA